MSLRARTLTSLLLLPALSHAQPAAQPAAKPAGPVMSEVLAASKPSDWRPLDLDNTVYMELPAGRVIIELAPAFGPQHARNIKTLVREGYFDGLAIIRAQDNYVAQWGDPEEENEDKSRRRSLGAANLKIPAEFTVPAKVTLSTSLNFSLSVYSLTEIVADFGSPYWLKSSGPVTPS